MQEPENGATGLCMQCINLKIRTRHKLTAVKFTWAEEHLLIVLKPPKLDIYYL